MVAAMGRVERRGRKRRRNDVQSVEADQDGKKRMVGTRSKVLVGRYVRKEFEGSGTFLGKIMNYDSGLYRVNYEDGDCEDLDSSELKGVLIDEDALDGDWLERKKKLDELVFSKEVTTTDCHVGNAILPTDVAVHNMTAPPSSDLGSAGPNKVEAGQVDDNAESMSDLSEDDEVLDLISNVETPVIPPPELPLSSGNIGVPEEFVSYLFSVYSFLRSFSIRLFLSPFGLDDFVGSLNCPIPNTLLDSVHVALMRVLKRHIEKLSLDGSERASKCLRNLDWSLLDSMTWPIYLVEYLMVMGYINGPVWKGFGAHVLEREYYSLSVGQKLMILQILCDDVLDSEEVRAEMDIREESEFGMDSDGTAVAPMSGPRRVHPRYSKTSAFKEQESMEIIAKDHDMRSSHNASSLSSKVSSLDAGTDVDHDGNGDECRLCGMDGTLLCCDGCPSSYHARCIGVCKMYIPDGNWYCPECRINELRPTPIRGTSLKGAELFGVDSHGQIFMGSCDHLLVLKDSTNSESCFRYYNENDISRVLQALNTNVQHHALYSEICKGIREFWGIPANVLPHTRVTEIGTGLTNRIEDSGCSVPSFSTSLGKESHFSENFASCATEISSENTHFHKYPKELMLNEASDRIVQPDNGNFTVRQASEHMNSVPLKQIPGRPTICAGSVSQQVDLSRQTQKDNTVLIETASCTSRNSSNCIGYDSVHGLGAVPSECGKFHERTGERSYKNSTEGGLYTGSSFKAQGYVNNYLHGDFAASAAANLAILSSEENQCSESHSLEKRRKLMSVDIQLQTKAFSSAATRFFWPNIEKKLIEVPRERCSWCLSCKAPVVSKKACLLNAAASNATKGAMKILAAVRPAKSGDGNLPGIATYIILMEESLRGLTVGPFLSATFRKNWHKQAEEATSCYTIKSLLLELEENIRLVALSADWVKLVDGCSSDSSVSQTASSVTGSTHKRKPGRRGRKPSAVSDVTADDGQDVLTDFTWWRGGMLSKFMFQRGTLPQSMVNKAARQGGTRKIPGIYYSEGCEAPKRNRRLVWRAAVEMCKTASQLALQVRYLDMHVRWSDLVRPELSLQEGKGLETEASAFRNAFICDKGMVDNEIRYGVAFGNQKHLSSRVMKSVIDIGQRQDGKEKYWFSESRIPLYLIKEYEAKLVKTLPSAVDNPMNAFSKWSRKSSKTFRGDIFSYLSWKRDGNDKHSCAFCQMDVLLRNGIKCSVCEGLCHEQCTTSSMFKINDVQCIITCKHCHQNSSVTRCGISNESPTSPLLLQRQDFANVDTVRKGGMLGSCNRLSASTGGNGRSSGVKQTSSANSKAKTKSWGVIWKKQNATDTGADFRKKNILRKGDLINGSGPDCQLCRKTYNSNLMYIHCETCQNWYHADALELEESNISNVVGFKCCRCRRIRIPICPYLDPDSKKQLTEKRIRARPSKVDDLGMDSDSGIISEKYQEEEPSTPMVHLKEEIASIVDDDFLCSLSSMEKITKQNPEVYCENTASLSGRGPKKLPIRRHVKHENYLDSSFANNPSNDYSSTTYGENTMCSTGEVITPCVDWGAKLPVRRPMKSEDPDYSFADPQVELSTHLGVEWNTSTNGCEDGAILNCDGLSYEDMEFEPQTYFSFNELLESDDCAPFDGGSGNATEKWENASELPHGEMSNIPNTGYEPLISIESAAPAVVPCMMCSHTDPSPTLCCQTCGIQIHGHCSPWVEQPSTESFWRCGNCREWR